MGLSAQDQNWIKHKKDTILRSKNIIPLIEQIQSLPIIPAHLDTDNGVRINALNKELATLHQPLINHIAHSLKPWRKGPFYVFDLFIDSEWRSFIKWQLLESHLHLENKHIADVGCNNGYYMFEMLKHRPASITGFDPNGIFKCQFDFINHFAQTPINFELLGVEDLSEYVKCKAQTFDVIFCLGVLYHRTDPIQTLKNLYRALENDGELILDTLIFDSELEVCLCPKVSYAKMKNAYFIPSITALQGWCERAGFKDFEILTLYTTTPNEQRKTEWIESLSLESFLNETKKQTIEGYPAPQRGYFKMKKSSARRNS